MMPISPALDPGIATTVARHVLDAGVGREWNIDRSGRTLFM